MFVNCCILLDLLLIHILLQKPCFSLCACTQLFNPAGPNKQLLRLISFISFNSPIFLKRHTFSRLYLQNIMFYVRGSILLLLSYFLPYFHYFASQSRLMSCQSLSVSALKMYNDLTGPMSFAPTNNCIIPYSDVRLNGEKNKL